MRSAGTDATAVEHLDLAYDAQQEELASAVRTWSARNAGEDVVRSLAGTMPWELWRSLADVGVLALGTVEGGGGALEITAAMEVLGEAVVPGPLVSTFMTSQLVDVDQRTRLGAGTGVASVGSPPLLPWAPVAEVFVELAPDGAWIAEPVGEIEPVATLGGEPWGRVQLRRLARVDWAEQAVALGDIAVAAYLVGATARLVDTTAQWARDRTQFGRSIGEFQSVAHPLTDVAIRLRAARNLTRQAAYAFDERPVAAPVAAAATARLSATKAALDATYRSHQTFGALGYTVEGPVALVGHRIRQLSLHPPGPGAARDAVLTTYQL